MEISPRAQALMLLASALAGVAAGAVFDLIGVFYRSLGVGGKPSYYARRLPLVGVIGQNDRFYTVVTNAVLFCADILFPLAWAAAQLCVFFVADDGIFRISGLLAGAVGFFVWRKTLGVLFRASGSFIVYILRVIAAYICFPAAFLRRAVLRVLRRTVSAALRACRERTVAKQDAAERERLLTLAGAGFDMAGVFGRPQNNSEKEEGNVKNERRRKILRQSDSR